jgi:predicted aconitase
MMLRSGTTWCLQVATAEARVSVGSWLNFPGLIDEDWDEAKRKEQAMMVRLEE